MSDDTPTKTKKKASKKQATKATEEEPVVINNNVVNAGTEVALESVKTAAADNDYGQLEVVLTGKGIAPTRADDGAAGYDLYCQNDTIIYPGSQIVVLTGVKLALPPNTVGLIWPRSGLAVKNEIDTRAGVIDESYRGEIGVVLRNDSDRMVKLPAGSRVAQLLIMPYLTPEVVVVGKLDETPRGGGGFGSTGE